TPHDSSNSYSLRGSLTRATTRGTPNSVVASRLRTRLALSSPVAAITTSYCSSPVDSRDLSSQASACTHVGSGMDSGSTWSSLRSMSITSWALPSSSRAIERPTAPAPAIATFMWASSRVDGSVLVDRRVLGVCDRLRDRTGHGRDIDGVVGLQHRPAVGQQPGAEPDQERDARTRGILEVGDASSDPPLVHVHLGDGDGSGGIAPAGGLAVVRERMQETVGGPRHSRHGGDAEPLVRGGPLGVVDS